MSESFYEELRDELDLDEKQYEKLERELNEYLIDGRTFVEGFTSKIFRDGILDDVSIEQLKKYLSDPEVYQEDIERLIDYEYIVSAEVGQLFDIVRSLPTLNYRIDVFEKTKTHDKQISKLNKYLNKVKHKTLTRDLLVQTVSSGTTVGIWLGDKDNLYPIIFDDLKHIKPTHRINGDWAVTIDMVYLEMMNEFDRNIFIKNISPYITITDYNQYVNDRSNFDKRYITLPQERTFVINTRTLKRNRAMGLSWATTGLYDIQHKNKMKELEKAVANKIIHAVALLTIGSEKELKYSNLQLKKIVKQKIHNGVKMALEKQQRDSGMSVITIPEFAKLEFPDIKGGDSLKPEKFESINADIQSAYGISGALLNGTGGNFASSKVNLEMLYKRIGIVLETIEQEVYNKMFNLVLPATQKDNFVMIYDKVMPLTQEKQLEYLYKLHTEGFAVKPIVDRIEGIEFSEYVEQSIHELDNLELPNKIKPYQTSYTMTSKGTKQEVTEIVKEGTETTVNNGGNETPSPTD